MLTKVLALVQSKTALAVLGAVLVGGTGTAAALAATSGHSPLGLGSSQHTGTEATKGADASNDAGDHGDTLSFEGVLKGYNAGGQTISVQTKDKTSSTTIAVDSNTRVDGEHANSLGDLSKNIGHDVEVQATKRSGKNPLAWKITLQGADSGDTEGNDNGDHGQSTFGQHTIVLGTIASVGSGSFVVKRLDGSTVTVTVNSSTRFEGAAHSFADLKKGLRVAAEGTTQSNGSVLASAIQAVAGE